MTNETHDETTEAEELLREAGDRTRDSVEPDTGDRDDEDLGDLTTAARDAYKQLATGELHSNVTVRDEDLAAFFAALEQTDQLGSVGDRAAAELSQDDAPETKAGVLEALARLGIEHVAVDEWEARADGQREFLIDSVE
jgi:hypothetical protein